MEGTRRKSLIWRNLMPSISVFGFERDYMQLAGPFYQMHMRIDGQPQNLVWESMWSLSPTVKAIVAYERPDTEICQNLSDVVNSPAVLSFVDSQFANAPYDPHVRPPVRKGPIRTSYKTWGDILAAPQVHVNDANAHQSWELINTISLDFHCNTDWYLSALDGTISLYAFYFLAGAGKPQVRIEVFFSPCWDEDWRPDWGAAGPVRETMAGRLGGDEPALQTLLQN